MVGAFGPPYLFLFAIALLHFSGLKCVAALSLSLNDDLIFSISFPKKSKFLIKWHQLQIAFYMAISFFGSSIWSCIIFFFVSRKFQSYLAIDFCRQLPLFSSLSMIPRLMFRRSDNPIFILTISFEHTHPKYCSYSLLFWGDYTCAWALTQISLKAFKCYRADLLNNFSLFYSS